MFALGGVYALEMVYVWRVRERLCVLCPSMCACVRVFVSRSGSERVWLSVCLCVLESQQCPCEMCSLQLTVERTQSTER